MLAPLLWLSPSARELLQTASQLLRGGLPCPAAKLASALREADSSQCPGLLGDAQLRAAVATELESSKIVEISDKTAAELVDLLGVVLQKRFKDIKERSASIAKALPANGGQMPSFAAVAKLLPKGEAPSDVMRRDWLLNHAVGQAHQPQVVVEPPKALVCERFAMAACAGSGLAAESALALHVLENVDAYVAWEASLPGSQPPSGANIELRVHTPFDKKTAAEVALRRVLAHALPMETATAVAVETSDSSKVREVLQKLATAARAEAVIPLYAEPPAPKEAKEPREKKEKDAKPVVAGAAAPRLAAGTFGALHKAVATQELQWNLLAYRMRPSTTLSAAEVAGPASTKAPAAAKGGVAVSTSPPPAGFAGVWSPTGTALPPGHTPYSWTHTKAMGMSEGFACTWSPSGAQCPPGHTPYSWEKAIVGATPSSASAKAPAAPKAAKAEAAGKAPAAKAPAAKAAAAPPAAGGPAEGSDEAALCKLDIRCGRILECSRVPDADSLYLLKINVGEAEPRQVVSSLVKHYKEEELQNRQVLVYCNIKPGKMRGFDSQAMVLAATKDKGADNEKCELLAPPTGVPEGTRPMCAGLEVGSLSATQNVKTVSKVWGQVQPLLLTSDRCEATFKGNALTIKDVAIGAPSLSGVQIS